MGKIIDIHNFGSMIDEILRETEILLFVHMPQGSMEPEIKSSFGAATLDLYVILHALEKVIDDLFREGGLMDPDRKAECLEAILDLVRQDMLEKND